MYGRRSQSKAKQEHSFAYQVEVAMKRARDVNVPLAVDAALVARAERTGVAHIGDLYVDDGVSGSELSRPGLDQLIADLKADRSISHVFVHKRDRLARPHRTSDGARLEEEIVELGVTIVFEHDIIQPRPPGEDDTVEVVTRVYCLCEGCGALMYGHKQHGDLKYICSRYEESNGKECEHNAVSSERLFEFACRLVTHGLGVGAGEAAMRDKLREHATRVRNATPESRRKEAADFWAAKVDNLVGDVETAGRRMAIERDDAAYEVLKREYSRLNRDLASAKAEHAKATNAQSAGDDLSIDEEVEAGMRLVRHLAAVLLDTDNREEAQDIFRRLGIQIGLTFGAQKFGPKRFVRRLKGGVVVYGDAELPRPERSDATAENVSRAPIPEPQTVDPFARALIAAVDPNARKSSQEPRSPPGRCYHEHGLKRHTRRENRRGPDQGQVVRS
jgi:hypothetical protein